ncbi:MAG: hypothetical protein LH630_03985 [Actinomycetia bacterium]|nr:hypothetical protein [Actinomycetes bacterium]
MTTTHQANPVAHQATVPISPGVALVAGPAETGLSGITHRDPAPWLRLSLATAALGAIGSVIALLDVQRFYGAETEFFIDQAIAQDVVNLAIVMPLMAFFTWQALRGSAASYLVWLGFLTFTVYNYFIYTFSIHFGPLFLLWVAALGTSIFALVGGSLSLDANAVGNALDLRKQRLAAGFLMLTAVLFAFLWLSDIVPALVDGAAPTAATDVNLPTNPVHVLDLAFFLPAVAIVGGSLWQRRALGYAAAPAMLIFLAITGLPVLATVFVADARGNEPAWQLLGPIGVITAACTALTWVMVHKLRLHR